LALYKELVEKEFDKKVVATAYYLMPENCLYSTYSFQGEHTSVITEEENIGKDLFLQVKNSYKYRLEEIKKGRIELGEGKKADDLKYVKDTPNKGLMPLRTREEQKQENIFSNYKCFKK
jgi:hypothetical protein